jgi:5-methylthioadenosine/S-adenosylhomocysteine deaminase
MSASVIRSRAMVTHTIDRYRWNEITDGAVLQEDGRIVEIGTYQDLSRKHPKVPVVGSGNEVMLPGFVNGHHHIGLTPARGPASMPALAS